MIDAMDVYWVMQLDTIRGVAIAFSVVFGIGTAIWVISRGVGAAGDEEAGKFSRAIWFVPVVFCVALSAVVFAPSSKTAAAMILVPALTSDQVLEPVSAEAKELYALAKSALRNLGDKADEPKPEKQE